MVFAIHWHESAMDLHVFPILIPPPTSLSTQFLWVFPVHQPRALVSCIQPGLVICFTLDSVLVSMLFSRNTFKAEKHSDLAPRPFSGTRPPSSIPPPARLPWAPISGRTLYWAGVPRARGMPISGQQPTSLVATPPNIRSLSPGGGRRAYYIAAVAEQPPVQKKKKKHSTMISTRIREYLLVSKKDKKLKRTKKKSNKQFIKGT